MSIKGTFILEHPHVKAIFGRKKAVQSKSVPEMAVFRKFWWRSVKGLWCSEGSNFGLFYWLAPSPL